MKFTCPCGAPINEQSIPSYNQLHVVPDKAVEGIVHKGDAYEVIQEKSVGEVYECSACGRLLVFREDRPLPRVYVPLPSADCVRFQTSTPPEPSEWPEDKAFPDATLTADEVRHAIETGDIEGVLRKRLNAEWGEIAKKLLPGGKRIIQERRSFTLRILSIGDDAVTIEFVFRAEKES